MNRRTALSVVATAAVTVAAGRAQGQTITLYPGPPAYDPTTGTGYRSPSVPTHPGMTAGNGVGVGAASNYSGGSYLATVAYRIGNTGTVTLLQPATANTTNSVAYAVNAAGTTVGLSNMYDGSGDNLGTAAVSWNASGGVTLLGTFGTNPNTGQSFGVAYAVNATGVSAGDQEAYNAASGSVVTSQFATRWDASGNITQLAPLSTSTSGLTRSAAYAINSAGTAVGYASVYSGTTSLGTRAALWAGGGTAVTALGTIGSSNGSDGNPVGATSGTAYAVNDSGTSVGNVTAYTTAGNKLGMAPTRWDASGNVTQLGTLSTLANGTFSGTAYAVNSAGTAVGISTEYNSSGSSIGTRATIWAAGTTAAVELPNLGTNAGGSTTTQALSINDDGLAVGSALVFNSSNPTGLPHATLWLGNGSSVVDLNTLLSSATANNFVLNTAESISNTDWVTALATYEPTGYQEEVLFNVSAEDPAAAPEPTSLALLAAAAAVPLLGRRRRQLV